MRRALVVLAVAAQCLAVPTLAQSGHSHSHGAGQMTPIPHDQEPLIRDLLMEMFDRPDAPLSVQPIVIEGNVALAGWAQDGHGGRALLRLIDSGWYVALCAGPELLEESFVQGQGLDHRAARRLVLAMRAAEGGQDGLSDLLDSFDTVLFFDRPAHGAHGYGHSHGHSHGGN